MAFSFVEPDYAVTISALAFIVDIGWVGIGQHRELIAQTIFEIACPRQRAVGYGIRSGPFVEWMPPAAVDRIDQRWTGKGIGAIAMLLNPLLGDDSEVLITAKMYRPSAANFFEQNADNLFNRSISVFV